MKPWMYTVLTISACSLILAAAVGIYRVMDAADRSVERTPGLFTAFQSSLTAVAIDTAATQVRLVAALERVSVSASGAMDRTARAAERALGRIATRFDRLADNLERAVDTISCEVPPLLRESTALVRSTREDLIPAGVAVLDGAAETLASARGIAEQARIELAASGAEVRQAVAGVRPLLDASTSLVCTVDGIAAQGERIAESGANVAAHYEQMILHPTWSQRAKGWFQMLLAGFTVAANSKILF